MFEGAQSQCGSTAFLAGAGIYSRGVPLGGKGSVRLSCGGPRWWHQSRSLLLCWKLLSQPSSYHRNHSSQALQFVHCHKLNHQRKVIQQTGNCRGRPRTWQTFVPLSPSIMKTEAYTFAAPGRFVTVCLSESQAARRRSCRKCVGTDCRAAFWICISGGPGKHTPHRTNLFLQAGAGCKHQSRALRLPPLLPARHVPVKPPCERLARVL